MEERAVYAAFFSVYGARKGRVRSFSSPQQPEQQQMVAQVWGSRASRLLMLQRQPHGQSQAKPPLVQAVRLALFTGSNSKSGWNTI